MATFDLGDVVRLDFTVKVDGALTAPTTIALTVQDPAGVITAHTPVLDVVGTYHYDFVPTVAGGHIARWVTTGVGQTAEEHPFTVVAAYARVVSVAEAKLRLGKTQPVDDGELQSMIDSAVRAYRRIFGRISGSSTETLTVDVEGRVFLRSRNATVVSAVVDGLGGAVTYDAYDETDEGILRGLAYGQSVTVTYQVGIPEDHQEVILADVAGYFAATQRGGQRGALPGEGYAAGFGEERTTPLVLFPRIRSLAPARVA